jgi:RHH-type proline utilization regulon transcriptional repressor/proline dehydrogenase/delta 1-pyrroline-5-carboxylate dehydrogenase
LGKPGRRDLAQRQHRRGRRQCQPYDFGDNPRIAAALFAGSQDELLSLSSRLAERDGRIVPIYLAPCRDEWLVDEISLSVNTAAAGGNASLMTLG